MLNFKKLTAVLGACLISASLSTAAEALTFKPVANAKTTFLMEGRFDQQSYADFSHLLTKHKDQRITIQARSTGGYANTILDIATLLQQHGDVHFIVRSGDACLSACAILTPFSASTKGDVYFHAVSAVDIYGGKTKSWEQNLNMITALGSVGVEREVSEQMFKETDRYMKVNFDHSHKPQIKGGFNPDELREHLLSQIRASVSNA